jgi:hypothetical protein
MKLDEAIRIGEGVGLTTVEECVNNIRGFAMCIFPYSKINEELDELYKDYDNYIKNEKIHTTTQTV